MSAAGFTLRRLAAPGLAAAAWLLLGPAAPWNVSTPRLSLPAHAEAAVAVLAPAADLAPAIQLENTGRVGGAASAPSGAAPARPWGRLLTAFAASTDLRAYAIEARKAATEGGGFYAMRALSERRLHASDSVGEDTAFALAEHRRLQAAAHHAERWALRCAGFLPEEISDEAVAAIAQTGLRSGDPLLRLAAAWNDAVEADDPDALRAAWSAIVSTGDPSLLEWAAAVGAGLASLDPLVRGSEAPEAGNAPDDAQMWSAVACELGAGCVAPRGPRDALCQRLVQCAHERWGAKALLGAAEEASQRAASRVGVLVRRIRERDAGLIGVRRDGDRP